VVVVVIRAGHAEHAYPMQLIYISLPNNNERI
jgi:hypothetical protein